MRKKVPHFRLRFASPGHFGYVRHMPDLKHGRQICPKNPSMVRFFPKMNFPF